MRIPSEWLREFVGFTVSEQALADRLTMIGFEVEGLERLDGDTVFEVNVTPNRPDCLSILGIGREVAASYGLSLRFPEHIFIAETSELDFNLDIIDPDLCPRYAGRIVRGLAIGPSPEWMQRRLEKCGIRSINNIVDVTNYVLLELGHPLHAFDLDTIRGHRIIVGTPVSISGKSPGLPLMRMSTLDGVEREIPDDGLLIWDAERPIAVAGIMGGHDTEVRETTKAVFIESAYFEPRSIRRTSKALGLKTESSYRFERGTDIKLMKKALDRAAYLVNQVAGGAISGKIDLYPKRYLPAKVEVSYDKVNRVLGLDLKRQEMMKSLSGLGLEIQEGSNYFSVKPPPYRRDIQRDVDVIEEIARMYGYEKIPAVLPAFTPGGASTGEPLRAVVLSDIRQSMLKCGFTEVINYSFMGLEEIDRLRIGEGDTRRSHVPICNPLRVEDSAMRTALVPAFIRNLLHNVAHGNREFRFFEMAKVFIGAGLGNLPNERTHLGVLMYRERQKTLYPDETPDFLVLKGTLENIFETMMVKDFSFVRSDEPFLHPGQSADIFTGGNRVGFCGVLSPVVVESLDIKAQKPAVLIAEIDIDSLMSASRRHVKYDQLPKYPAIERDTAIVVDASLEAARITGWVRSYPSNLIEEVAVFDVFQGGSIPAGRKSVAFRVRYRATDRTLKDEEIDVIHQGLIAEVLNKTGGELRR